MAYNPVNPNGSATSANSAPVVIASDQATVPVSNASLPLPTLAATSTKQSDGTQKTQIVDASGNVASMTANAQDVNIKSGNLTTLPVTNVGTFAVQSTNQTQTDTVMIGGVNVKEINAVTPLMGNGTTGTGSLRVTISSDNSSNTNPFLIAGGKTNNNAAPGATNVGVLPAVANAAIQTWTEGNEALESVDLSGNQRVTMGTALSQAIDSILSYPFGHSYAHISTSTTTTVKSGAGVLHNISINTLGTVASTTTIYDNTAGSGTVIGVINSLTLSGAFILDVAFTTGLTIVTTGTVAPDVTVSYR